MRRLYIVLVFFVSVLLVFIVVTNIAIQAGSKPYIYSDISKVPTTTVALIPGASILQNGEPSSVYRDRVDMAIELYNLGKVSKILVSGDNSTVDHNEVNPVRHYLLDKNIPEEDIFLDHAGFDTYSSMYRAIAIFGVNSVTITSQSFHLPRAIFLARSLGMKAYGMNADSGNILQRNYIREVFADEKAVIDLIFHREPKYLGDKIPITN